MQKKVIFAIRQIGKPTWFCSFSAAETRWTHLPRILGKLVNNKNYTDTEIEEMSWQKKSILIQSDPVTCARHFDHMVQIFMNQFLKSNLAPVGEITDFFYRVEFQHRGSPHILALFWIKDASQYGINSMIQEITEFVEKYVTCKNDSSKEMTTFVNYQTHRHAKTCKKRGGNVCRFNFPIPPMAKPIILTPLAENTEDTNEWQQHKINYSNIKVLLEQMKLGDDITFEEFLQKLNLTEHQYIRAI